MPSVDVAWRADGEASMSTLSLGPWIFPVAVIGLLLGVCAAEAVAAFLRRRGFVDAGSGIWIAWIVALVCARAGYVVQFWPSYHLHPWDIPDVRDMGFNWAGGVLGLLLALVVLAWRKPAWWPALPISLLVGLVVSMLVGFTAQQLQSGSHPPLPQLTLRDLDGREIAMASLEGKPTVINLWATWCPPCRREMPMLVDAQQSQPNVRFVFADQGESAATIRHFLQEGKLAPRNVLLDSGMQLARYYRAPGYPTTVFLDANGRLRDIHVGPLSAATLQQRLQGIAPTLGTSPGEAP